MYLLSHISFVVIKAKINEDHASKCAMKEDQQWKYIDSSWVYEILV